MDESSASAPLPVAETVPINIAPSTEGAPPALAEPASGPVATISGALQGPDVSEAPKSSVEASGTKVNRSTEMATRSALADAQPSQLAASTLAVTTKDDEAMKDDAAPAANVEEQEANGTPATPAKKQSNGKRKSTGGIPEHKSKKLNKKKSVQKITHLDAQPGDYYFARLKSYPPWPSIICEEDMLPQSLITTRPVTTKQQDGTYRADYADGGKKAQERTYPIMFLQTNEFAWIPNTDLTPLDPAEIKDFSEKGKTKSLVGAYHVAAEAHPLQYFKDMLADHQKAMQEDLELREQREAAKAAKASKKKRKSEAADEDVDMEDADADEAENKKSSKKRKKEVESEGDEEKPAKTPRTAQKLKLTTPKAPGTAEKKETAKATKPKSEKKKSAKAAASDEEMAEEEVKEPAKPADPVQERKDREKEVLFLRHKLQKGFLSRDQAPQESEMAAMSNYIKKLEGYGELEAGIIRTTKINKVLKALIKLNTIPKDEEFNFRGRSVELLGKWNKLLGTDGTGDENGAGPSSAVEKDDKPTTNGTHKDDKELDVADKPAAIPTELAESAEAVKAAREASTKSKEAVVDSLVKDIATEGDLGDAQKAKEEPKPKESGPIKLDQAPVSAEGAAEAAEVAKATE